MGAILSWGTTVTYKQCYFRSHINWLFKAWNASFAVIFHCDTGNFLHGWGSIAPRTGQLVRVHNEACKSGYCSHGSDGKLTVAASQSHTCRLLFKINLLLKMDFEHTFHYHKDLLCVTLGIISPRSPSIQFLCKSDPLGGCKEMFLLMQNTQICLKNLYDLAKTF